jgi:pimeloyl-ACP methyl ester carboxylesterase
MHALKALAVCGCLLVSGLCDTIYAQAIRDEKPSLAQPTIPTIPVKTGPPTEIHADLPGKPETVLNGVWATQAQCDAISQAVWAQVQSHSACIRYFPAGFGASALVGKRRAVAYFTGDVYDGRRVVPEYATLTASRLQATAEEWAQTAGLPLTIVGRPGILGSSGDHMERRRKPESLLMSAALDVLGQRLDVQEWVLLGYSGGGHVVTSLLTYRQDVVCAVPTASVASPRLRAELRNWALDATGYSDSYEPLDFMRAESMHPQLRVIVVGDPQDKNGVWPAQTVLADKLRSIGVAVDVVEVKGTGPLRHGGQGGAGRLVASWCGHDLSFEDIQRKAAAL